MDVFQRMLDEKVYTNLNVTAEGQTIGVHRGVLASRSPVFREMLEKGTKEEIEFEDLEFETLQHFINYIYFKPIVVDETMTCKLLAAAERYAVDDLTQKCKEDVDCFLKMENAFNVAALGDSLKCRTLQSKAAEFIADILSKLVMPSAFNKVVPDHDFVNSVLEKITRKEEERRRIGNNRFEEHSFTEILQEAVKAMIGCRKLKRIEKS
ncbi:unnamed protein product [Caenorhabditis auriculariae]|uniref:BTB domain-containing protein n=1 Tax=Caenorhabditis auriculariae TaxID=2777116 RepID=A0A8S1GT78_9PELO|nr:unnamed protein product [Caenorhabditis auriculariae]